MSTVVKTLEPLQDFDDIPVAPFVYTVPTKNDMEDHGEDTKEGEAVKDEVKKENGHHYHYNRHHRYGHRHRIRSPRSPTVYSDTVLYKNLGLNFPKHHTIKGR
ncbi:hypothetical protein HHK36_033136 [Tetracentron sinense]|uniref:Uncharacterized protein n=1 Tax=Tetracentron sinense TaxID=13715 RepID=A0A834Y952_TETSI|nr:hypothetical protein HHK36_033136 [Tetracentron sinense]